MEDEKKIRESAGGIVLNKNGHVALVCHGRDPEWWGFPKGGIAEGENKLIAAKREIEEEVGLSNIELKKELGNYRRFRKNQDGTPDTQEIKVIYMFLFQTEEEKLVVTDSYHPEARWVPQEEVATLLSDEEDRRFYLSVQKFLI